MNNDTNKEQGYENEFYSIQRPLIHLIEEYLLINSVEGKRMTIKRFCELAGVQDATMTAILTGNRWVAKCSRDTVEKLAITLKIPVLQVYIFSGFIQSADMLYSSDVEETVHKIYLSMVKDKRMAYRAPIESVWTGWPISAKLSLCMMYEQLTEKVLFRYAAG